MLPELKSTVQQLLKLPQEEAEQQIADGETAEEVKGRIHQLLARASYKYVKERVLCRCVDLELTLRDLGVLKNDLT